jgi:hypothetical protein
MQSTDHWKLLALDIIVDLFVALVLLSGVSLLFREYVIEVVRDHEALMFISLIIGLSDAGKMRWELEKGMKFWDSYSRAVAYAIAGGIVVLSFEAEGPSFGPLLWFLPSAITSTIAYIACTREWKRRQGFA